MGLKANTMGGPILSMLELLQEGENVFGTEKGFKVNWLWVSFFNLWIQFSESQDLPSKQARIKPASLEEETKRNQPTLATDNG